MSVQRFKSGTNTSQVSAGSQKHMGSVPWEFFALKVRSKHQDLYCLSNCLAMKIGSKCALLRLECFTHVHVTNIYEFILNYTNEHPDEEVLRASQEALWVQDLLSWELECSNLLAGGCIHQSRNYSSQGSRFFFFF